MNLKKLFGCGAALGAAACLFASPSQAYDANFHVYQAGNGVGDALIFPVYYADGNMKTNLRVVNTSPTYSMVAKVVFRESNSSCETRSFLIYLSPNDEWTADVVDVNGTTTIHSEDDSSPVVPLKIDMAPTCNGYSDKVGYVEVYGAAAFLAGSPVSKTVIKKAYDDLPASFENSCSISDPTVKTCYPSQNVLAGVEEIKVPSANLVMPMVATALANNFNKIKLNPENETRWDTYGNNSEYEVRAALAKSAIHIPYRNDANNATFAVFNFPVKMSCIGSGSPLCTGTATVCDPVKNTIADFGTKCTDASKLFATAITQDVYDLQENSTTNTNIFSPAPPGDVIDKEVYITKLAPSFAEGWVRVKLTDAAVQQSGTNTNPATTKSGANISYAGSAVIPSYLQAAYDLTWVPATFDCSVVTTVERGDANTPPTTTAFDNCTYQLAPNKR